MTTTALKPKEHLEQACSAFSYEKSEERASTMINNLGKQAFDKNI